MSNHSPEWKYFYTAKNSILELAGMFYRQENTPRALYLSTLSIDRVSQNSSALDTALKIWL